MAEASFALAVENLAVLLIQKTNIPLSVHRKAQGLKDELQIMRNLLRDAAERRTMRGSWITQLREVAQDAEDVIRTFSLNPGATSSMRRRPLLAFFLCSSEIHAHDPAGEIESVRTRLQEIIRMRDLVLSFRSEDLGRQSTPTTSFQQNDEHVVGMDPGVALLLDRAILNGRARSVATIVGIGGIGKTTLARSVYNNRAVADHFDWRAWIFVSSHFSLEAIMMLLARELLQTDEIPETIETFPMPDLQIMLRRLLSGRRYLVVLDDVWEYADLLALLTIFPNEGTGSRLLITSRNRDITTQAHWVHEMTILDHNNSWQLLLNTAFFRRNDRINCPEHLEHIGREILTKCHGLPSAIKAVGRLLMARESAREWEDVRQTMDLSVMSDAFELSYQRLPPELKLCFLCLALFRQGTPIRAEKLVQVWTAGGMVLQEEQMEEIAASYLDRLISRYMVRIEDKTKDDRVKNCSVYDLFHKPSIKKAEDEISFEVLREEGSSGPIHKPRHRAIYCTRAGLMYSTNQNDFLRSLFFHGGGSFDNDASYWQSYQLLKVLDFEGFGLEEFPEAISSLNGLQYLGLRENYINELPELLGCLEKLKVLDISLNFAVVMPDVIWKMESLRHLYMSDIVCRSGLKIDRLKNLRTLAYISVDDWIYERSSLQTMNSLRKLGIHELHQQPNIRNLLVSLAHLRNLVCLNLRGSRYETMPSLNQVGYLVNLTHLKIDGLLSALPGAEDFPPNLCYLTLVNTSLDQDPMPVLEKLPKLLYIKLRNAYTEDVMVISQEGFPRLQAMRMGNLYHLRDVRVEDGAMPVLRRWEINGCPHLENLPERATMID